MSPTTISFEFDRDLIHLKDLANNRDGAVPLVITDHLMKKIIYIEMGLFCGFWPPLEIASSISNIIQSTEVFIFPK